MAGPEPCRWIAVWDCYWEGVRYLQKGFSELASVFLLHKRFSTNVRVCPWHKGHQLLPRDAYAARYLQVRLICQKDGFEPSEKGGVGMAYRGHRSVWGETKIKSGYEGWFHAMVIEVGGSVVQTTENIKVRKVLNEMLTTYTSMIKCIVKETSGYPIWILIG
ncbi:hypothetical protein DFJ58DRAFT_781369 [Suillus subalutaceus]|uniref:uncharacterized protein n=1 Tax=Suillus subalutaceus TaxID=48586 RepID=UPI001B86846C|nr:uncharacterized protein DFJ58DRAFT_781369 [Suillus subalutaceus]KAG1859039.1 hypothetical protein DFJ58DRAFT_781369 [Suillus subalutaceus]